MSMLSETNNTRMEHPTAGPVEQGEDQPPRAAVAFGPHRRLWFGDPAELAALEEVARTQRLRLEAILGHVPLAAAAPAPFPPAAPAPVHHERTAPAPAYSAPAYTGPPPGEPDSSVFRPYVPQSQRLQPGQAEAVDPTRAVRP
ncbi:hypothetical protein ACGFIV_00795 [Sphaerisporangium sp. NPDC049003]|uniref:hypothetical protein n=1 Tax=Sphaerisporangium sp. NPDC049003 TaxID=3364517 RepID=UPI0037238390